MTPDQTKPQLEIVKRYFCPHCRSTNIGFEESGADEVHCYNCNKYFPSDELIKEEWISKESYDKEKEWEKKQLTELIGKIFSEHKLYLIDSSGNGYIPADQLVSYKWLGKAIQKELDNIVHNKVQE